MEDQVLKTEELPAAPEFACSKHPEQLLANLLAGGVGYCCKCHLYVRALGVPEPPPLDRPARPMRKRKSKSARPVKRKMPDLQEVATDAQ